MVMPTNLPDGVVKTGGDNPKWKDREDWEPQFHDLGPDFPTFLAWSNKSSDLDLDVHFDPKKPNLADTFDVDGLKPILREKDSEQFLLKDSSNGFYFIDVADGRLWKFADSEKMDVKQAVHKVLQGIGPKDLRQQFRAM